MLFKKETKLDRSSVELKKFKIELDIINIKLQGLLLKFIFLTIWNQMQR